MSYATTNEKAPITPMQSSQPMGFHDNREIRRTRTILIVVLTIELLLAIIYLIQQSVYLTRYNNLPYDMRNHTSGTTYTAGVVGGVISIVYVILFLVFVTLHLRIPILIVTWLGVIQLIFIGAVLVITILAILASTIATTYIVGGFIASIIIIVLVGISSILVILSVFFGFKLSKLLKAQENYQMV
ncbi:unnamed protein product [Adineta ricciae]|uniref:Uncharacterized protein n=1 Tax=Adineta ricciae TaxID=249248 RepID=A0A814PAX1_ADIRI|nr:unnamed protein product [Adineta ricciae]CAF1391983.1 unnamed protein product [Adineta ricciae]